MALAIAGCQRLSHVDAFCGTETPGTSAKRGTEVGVQHRRCPAGTGTAVQVQIFTSWESAAATFPCSLPGLYLLQGVKVFHRSDAPVLRAGMLRYFRRLECESLQEHAL